MNNAAKRILVLSDNYVTGKAAQDPWREALLLALAQSIGHLLYIQTNDYISQSKGIFERFDRKTVLSAAVAFAPDVIVSINGDGLCPEVKKVFSSTPLKVWVVDAPWRLDGERFKCLANWKGAELFAAGKPSVDWINEHVRPAIAAKLLLFCANPDYIEPPLPVHVRQHDISYVGTLWPLWSFAEAMRKLGATQIQLNVALDLLRAHQVKYKPDLAKEFKIIFPENKLDVGQIFALFDDHISSAKRLNAICALRDFNVEVRGDAGWWAVAGLPFIDAAKSFNPEQIWNAGALLKLYRNSKICLNVAHHQAMGSGMPMRMFDAFSAGAHILTDSLLDEESGFIEGRHYTLFSEGADLAFKVKKLLAAPDHLIEWGVEAQNVILERHTFRHRIADLLDIQPSSIVKKNRLYTLTKLPIRVGPQSRSFEFNGPNLRDTDPVCASSTPRIRAIKRVAKLGLFFALVIKFVTLIVKKPSLGSSRRAALEAFFRELETKNHYFG